MRGQEDTDFHIQAAIRFHECRLFNSLGGIVYKNIQPAAKYITGQINKLPYTINTHKIKTRHRKPVTEHLIIGLGTVAFKSCFRVSGNGNNIRPLPQQTQAQGISYLYPAARDERIFPRKVTGKGAHLLIYRLTFGAKSVVVDIAFSAHKAFSHR